MVKLFKKQKLIKKEDYDFLQSVIKRMPSKYLFLEKQISPKFILDKKINELGGNGSYTLSLNANLEAQYLNKSVPYFFIIKDILIWNNKKSKFEFVELHILQGMIAGFRVNSKYSELDFNKININNIKEKNFNNQDKETLRLIIGDNVPNEVLNVLEIDSTFQINLDKDVFYVIKDFHDGNYLAMDKNGSVYVLIHDPYEINQIYRSKEKFFEDVMHGKFNILNFYNDQINNYE